MDAANNWLLVLTATVCPNIGLVNIYFIWKNMSWYKTRKKPKFIPLHWIFTPVWITLYCTMGYSLYLVCRDKGGFQREFLLSWTARPYPLSAYDINLALNWLWTPIFFEIHVKWAFYESVALSVSTLILGIVFYTVNPVAGYLMIPYFIWISLFVLFNYVIYRDNKQLPTIENTEEKKKINE